jgi:hypothetical protein
MQSYLLKQLNQRIGGSWRTDYPVVSVAGLTSGLTMAQVSGPFECRGDLVTTAGATEPGVVFIDPTGNPQDGADVRWQTDTALAAREKEVAKEQAAFSTAYQGALARQEEINAHDPCYHYKLDMIGDQSMIYQSPGSSSGYGMLQRDQGEYLDCLASEVNALRGN